MPAAGVVTLIGVAATVAVLAIYLITIAVILKHVNFTLGTIIAGVRSIANQAQPLSAVMSEINSDLTDVERAVDGLVSKAMSQPPAPKAPPAPQSFAYEPPAAPSPRKRKASSKPTRTRSRTRA